MAALPQKPILLDSPSAKVRHLERQNAAMKRLVGAVQELSLARTVATVQAIVRREARELTGADGATFVLREGDKCFYATKTRLRHYGKGNASHFPRASAAGQC